MITWNRWKLGAATALALIAIVTLSKTVESQLTPLPTPAPGITQTAVVNIPTVRAEQAGPWKVELTPEIVQRLEAASPVNPSIPSFLQAQKRYAFTWDAGRPAENYTVLEVRRDGWISASSDAGAEIRTPRQPLWLNAARAMAIQELR